MSIRETPSLGADLYLDATKSLTKLHKTAIEDGLDTAIVDALRALPGSSHAEWRQVLDEIFRADDRVDADVEADRARVGHALASVLAKAATSLRTDVDDDRRERDLQAARRALQRLGTGNIDNITSPKGDVFATTALLQEAGDAIPTRTIEVHLGVEWAAQRADQRRDVLAWLGELWSAHDVQLVVSHAAAARLVDAHRDQLPAHLTNECKRRLLASDSESDSRLRVQGGGEGGAGASERARLARDELSADSRKTAVVAHVAADANHALTYAELAEKLVLDSPSDGNLYQVCKRLEEEHGLVERHDRPDGLTAISLTSAGLEYITAVYQEEGRQTRLPGTVSGVEMPPQIRPPMPCLPAQGREGGGEEAAVAAGDRPAAEGAAAASPDRDLDWTHGLVAPEFAGYDRALPLEAASERGNIVLQNSRIRRDDVDPRQPRVSITDSSLVVEAGKAENPLQHATTIAHALAWEETRNRLLTPSDIDAVLDGDLDVDVLQDATGVGWLSEDDDGHDVAEAIDDALAELLFETGAYARGDHDVLARLGSDEGFSNESLLDRLSGLEPDESRELTGDEHRSLITAHAMGLATTIVHLLDLSGVDVTLGVRLPDFSRHFGASDDDNNSRRETLVEHLTTIASQWSRYGAFNGFKQLKETRDRKRSNADPDVDAADPFGTLRAGIVVIGRGVETLSDELQDALEDERDLHPDAPEINVAIDVQEGTSVGASIQTARRMLKREKNMEPTPEAISALAAFAADPWAVATAIHWGLKHEPSRRAIHLDEVRRALSQLPWTRLVEEPDRNTSTKRKAIKTLLEAEDPISAAELSRRGGPSTQSWRDHRDRLLELGLVTETDDGWRLTLPFRSERGDATASGAKSEESTARPQIPWFWRGESVDAIPGDLGREKRSPGDVLDWLLVERGLLEDTSRLHDPDDPVGRWADAYYSGDDPDWTAMQEICEEIDVQWRIIAAGCGLRQPDPPSHTASVGPQLSQTALSTPSASPAAD
ncbi:hypothetical protein D3D02_17125 [Halobellus sp. Atlit-38R]|nr:hypothetical protein D3D02_17125 [Halobellus sp. Atlit-38R]